MIKVAVFGYGNVGRAVVDVLKVTPDFKLCAIVDAAMANKEAEGLKIVSSIDEIPEIDVAILAVPSRLAPELAKSLLEKGINTVDGFDIHTEIVNVWENLSEVAKKNNASSIIAAGWDPGTDSIVRTMFQAMAPVGITYTNFGPGMSMGHTVAVRAIDGVANALSMTIPTGTGIHRRMVYIELKEGYDFEKVAAAIKADAYFAHDETHVMQVKDVEELKDMGHGVRLERKGASGSAYNQLLSFEMKINNPALTAQVLVCSARAVLKQTPGCYTLIEIPVVDFLAMDRKEAIGSLV